VHLNKVLVPAAGLGTRLLPATKSQPKEMLPVGRKPILQHVIEELQNAGLNQILLITGRRKRAIEDHFDFDSVLDSVLKKAGKENELAELAFTNDLTRFFYTRQSEQKGLGHAVALGADFVNGEDFAVALGDSLISAAEPASVFRSILTAFKDLNAAAVVAVEEVPPNETHRYGIVSLKSSAQPGEPVPMSDIVEKPQAGKAPSRLAVAARYVFSPAIFDALAQTPPDQRGEIQLTDAIRVLIRQGLPVYAWPLRPGEQRYDIGNFESYFKTFIDFCLQDEQYGQLMKDYLRKKADELPR